MSPWITSILLASLGLGTTTTFASSHWLLAWMGLEISTLAIIPLMAQQHHPRAVEAATKYFITQAAAAALLLFATTSNAWIMGEWQIQHLSHPLALTITVLALALKVGIAPLHFWLPEVLQGLDLKIGLILSTWQKLAPMILIFQLAPSMNPNLLIGMAITSTLVGGWGGLNQTQLRKIMAYSSIAHMGWMMAIIKFYPKLMVFNLAIYIIMTTAVFLTLDMLYSTKISTLSMMWSKTPVLMATTLLAMLSLGGLPPLTGFMPKWMILSELTKQDLPLTATVLALTALLSLFFYLRLCYATALTAGPSTSNNKTAWRAKSMNPNMPLSTMMTLSLFGLPMAPMAMSLLT
uniref:NADH dehydrogenase subunit 2 n=1 Tax=Monopenchelys acuta TaxID=1182258 RepID=UPI0028D0458A|nr:NADH dehydrogenase subunit 2 [Monopenchelys acuta]WMY90696.1 NADH dehydrogenase subunit 2 [Monopenchelys acuta]